jgi:hypothetical protein
MRDRYSDLRDGVTREGDRENGGWDRPKHWKSSAPIKGHEKAQARGAALRGERFVSQRVSHTAKAAH